MALLPRIKTRMAIHAHRKVRGLLAGEYASIHTGRSLDFQDLRAYVIGDEVKDIDWKASARRGEMLVKRFVADRKHTVSLVVPTGRSLAAMADPTTTKRDLAVFVAGVFGWVAQHHGDYVCAIVGNATKVTAARPAMTEIALEHMLQTIHDGCFADAPEADLTACLDYAVRALKRRTIMLVVTENVDLSPEDEVLLRRLRVQHEVMFVTLGDLDPADPRLEGQRVLDVDQRADVPSFVRDADLHREVAEADHARTLRRRAVLQRVGIVSEHVAGDGDVVNAIYRLLERHRHAA